MNFQDYASYHQELVEKPLELQQAPYNDSAYFDYAKMNWQRTNRWLKKALLTDQAKTFLQALTQKQKWILITEPWCGDAGQIVPFIQLMAAVNPHIQLEIELRDEPPFRIDQYLTKGGKAIPKLIIRDEKGTDKAVWGPRPQACQDLFLSLKEQQIPFEDIKIQIQQWYNQDQGVSIQQEIITLLASTVA
jgi:hypothetical protein